MKALAPLLAVIATLTITLTAVAEPSVATFSIVAADTQTRQVGVAVQSKYFAVGAVVPWLKAGVGAVATQPELPDGLITRPTLAWKVLAEKAGRDRTSRSRI